MTATTSELPEGLQPNLAVARAYLEKVGPPLSRVLVCSITGAHHYGFPSPDSDIDIKGIHVAPTVSLLGLAPPPKAVDRTEIFRGIECDLTTNEAGAALSLLLGGNGNMLERIFSPYQLVDSPAVGALRALAPGYLSRKFAAHYLGFGRGVRREYLKAAAPSVKRLLYVYRVALTGIHLMRSGQVCANVIVNAERYGYPEVLPLVARKRAGTEKGELSTADAKVHEASWERLDEELTDARDSSKLPMEASAPVDLSEWLVQWRLDEAGNRLRD